jgi:hypothetical protein
MKEISRSSTYEDVLNLLLVSSDSLISSLRKLPKKATKTYMPEALKLRHSERIGRFVYF